MDIDCQSRMAWRKHWGVNGTRVLCSEPQTLTGKIVLVAHCKKKDGTVPVACQTRARQELEIKTNLGVSTTYTNNQMHGKLASKTQQLQTHSQINHVLGPTPVLPRDPWVPFSHQNWQLHFRRYSFSGVCAPNPALVAPESQQLGQHK